MTTVLLDSEALDLLTPSRRHDPRRRTVLAHLEEATAVLVPRAVRVEAAVPRDAEHADVGRLTRDAEDHAPLRSHGRRVTDEAARARAALGTGIAVVDAVVAATACALAPGSSEVLTSDPRDLVAVVTQLGGTVAVVGL